MNLKAMAGATAIITNKSKNKSMRKVAQTLLSNKQFDIEFNGFLSNHAKHAIIALDRIDAPEERVQEYWNEYTALTPYKLALHAISTPWSEVKPCTLEEYNQWRGKKLHWQEKCAFLADELKTRFGGNTNELVREYAPPLLGGIAGALTHGIIHLGWGIDGQDSWMTVEGLAYLNFCYVGIDESMFLAEEDGVSTPMESLIEISRVWDSENLANSWIERVKQTYGEDFHSELVPAGFQWQLAKVLHEPHPVATRMPSWLSSSQTKSIDDKMWESLYRLTVELYLATRDSQGNGNFLVLHAITSLWGLEHVLNVIADQDISRYAVRRYWSTLVCLLAASGGGFPSSVSLKQVQMDYPQGHIDSADLDWTPMLDAGMKEEEEHNIKLVYVARELWNRFGQWKGYSEAARSFTLTPDIGPSFKA